MEKKHLSLLAILLLVATGCYAETIYKKDGETINVKIVTETRNTIWYEMGSGRLGISKSDIEKILDDDGNVSHYSPTYQISELIKQEPVEEERAPVEEMAETTEGVAPLEEPANKVEFPEKILGQVLENYLSMKNYSSSVKISHLGSIMAGLDVVGESYGSIKLAKPNYYKINLFETQKTGSSKREHATAIWNAGSGPYHFLGHLNAYSKVKDDESALRIASTVASFNKIGIVYMFFDFMQGYSALPKYLPGIEDLKLLGEEIINNEKCYVIEGSIKRMYFKYWISKDQNLIVKQHRQGIVIDLGEQESGEESKDEKTKEILDFIKKRDNANPKVTIEYGNIQTDIEQDVSAFLFEVPEGTRLSEDIFKDIVNKFLNK